MKSVCAVPSIGLLSVKKARSFTTTLPPHAFDVIIAGGGMVGSALGCILGIYYIEISSNLFLILRRRRVAVGFFVKLYSPG